MIRLMTGLAVAAAGAAVLANAGRRTRQAHSERAAERAADIARWEDDTGSPAGQPRTTVDPDPVKHFVPASAGS